MTPRVECDQSTSAKILLYLAREFPEKRVEITGFTPKQEEEFIDGRLLPANFHFVETQSLFLPLYFKEKT